LWEGSTVALPVLLYQFYEHIDLLTTVIRTSLCGGDWIRSRVTVRTSLCTEEVSTRTRWPNCNSESSEPHTTSWEDIERTQQSKKYIYFTWYLMLLNIMLIWLVFYIQFTCQRVSWVINNFYCFLFLLRYVISFRYLLYRVIMLILKNGII